ncbi:flavin-binding monooxygenase [Thozetella sp. PMI_491]|nr:flavin-binding monooxygenase [Thozetella sp. PMI_491]
MQCPGAVPKPPDAPVDYARPIKVVCIGAGMSGILCGIRFPQTIPNLDLRIYDKNDEVGGVWYENKYPGVTCDVPSHCFQYTFANNPNWSYFFSPGQEIAEYFNDIAERYDVKKYIRFGHLFKSARWLQDQAQWEITLLRLRDSLEFKDYCDVFVKATGNLNKWAWPQIPGLQEFQGPLIHSANWDESFDPTGKRVAVVGYGATAVQLVPAILPKVKYMDHYVRGQAWISPAGYVAADPRKANADIHNFEHSQEERDRFAQDPKSYIQYRHTVENYVNKAQLIHWVGSEMNRTFSKATEESMKRRLARKPEIFDHLKPTYPVACRRVSPGPKYLESLVEDNLNFIPKGIKRVIENGIVDDDGTLREVDAIICATGFNTELRLDETPIYGLGGVSLDDLWSSEPGAYMSIFPEKMPNLFLFVGPNGAPGAGSTIHMSECVCEYMIKCIQKIQRENIRSMVAKDVSIRAFMKQVDRYFAKSTFAFTCNNWAKRTANGRMLGYWPGSAVHQRATLAAPRFEDFEYTSFTEGEEDMLEWMGNGMIMASMEDTSTTGYLDNVQVPPPPRRNVLHAVLTPPLQEEDQFFAIEKSATAA